MWGHGKKGIKESISNQDRNQKSWIFTKNVLLQCLYSNIYMIWSIVRFPKLMKLQFLLLQVGFKVGNIERVKPTRHQNLAHYNQFSEAKFTILMKIDALKCSVKSLKSMTTFLLIIITLTFENVLISFISFSFQVRHCFDLFWCEN